MGGEGPVNTRIFPLKIRNIGACFIYQTKLRAMLRILVIFLGCEVAAKKKSKIPRTLVQLKERGPIKKPDWFRARFCQGNDLLSRK